MERVIHFDNVANLFVTRYNKYLESILGSYNRAILSGEFNNKTIKTFKDEVANFTKMYLEREREEIEALVNTMYTWVQDDTLELDINVMNDEEWQNYLEDYTVFLYDALKLQASKDNIYVNNFLRTKIIQLQSVDDYNKAYDLVFNHQEAQFFYTDKIGRKINSVKYIRTLVRDYLIKNYNDLIMGALMLNGKTEGTVINQDAGHKHHGKTISFVEGNELNYFDIRDDYFHPNSNSILQV